MQKGVKFSSGYVCGVVCSNGKVVWDEKHSNYSISLETKNLEFAELFAQNLSELGEKVPKLGQHKRGTARTNIVTLYGKRPVELIVKEWGITPQRRMWSAPKVAFSDSEFRRGFLTGFLDGNGSVYAGVESGSKGKKRSIRVYSVNRKGLTGVKRLLEMEGVKSIMYPCGDSFTIKIGGKMRLEVFVDKLGFGLTDKNRKLGDALLPQSLSGNEVNM